ncbi:MAG: thrombospondin type 3 repeat-containing protein, partial [Myxococcota bacterium]
MTVGRSLLVSTILAGCISLTPELDPPVSPDPTGNLPQPPPPACIEVLPGVLDLGERPPASLPVPTGAVVIRNACAETLEVGELFLSGAPTVFALIDPPALPTALESQALLTVGIRGEPTTYGRFTDFLTIATNDPVRPDTVIGLQIQAVCESAADDVDTDEDGIPDACDACEGGDDRFDLDGDAVPDDCDACPGFDDTLDDDDDSIPDDCDVCPAGDDRFD